MPGPYVLSAPQRGGPGAKRKIKRKKRLKIKCPRAVKKSPRAAGFLTSGGLSTIMKAKAFTKTFFKTKYGGMKMAISKRTLPGVYNPASQTKEELIANFVVRLDEFQTIFDVIKTDGMDAPPRHFIIQGQRGMGKTTLLLRLYHAVDDDEQLKQYLIPVLFGEEQYGIRTLYKLWEETALYLEEKFGPLFAGIYDEMQEYMEGVDYEMMEDYEGRCYDILRTRLVEKGAKLVLFIDNFSDMLNKFNREEQIRLQELLLQYNEIRVIAAAAETVEFDLFEIFILDGLNKEETENLLLQLGNTCEIDTVKDIIGENPGRVEALRRLTSGIPRTIILLFDIFLENDSGDILRDLERVLDNVTPLYKHSMDHLSPQKQEILNTVALNWDALDAEEISKKTRIPVAPVITHLNELENNGIVSEIPTSTQDHLYQLTDRFFNVWYLMRNGRRREQQKVLWLMRFLENWCSREELSHLAEQHIDALKTGNVLEKHAFYMTEALVIADIPSEIQDEMVSTAKEFLTQKKSTFAGELSQSYNDQLIDALAFYTNRDYEAALNAFLAIENKNQTVFRWLGFLYHRKFNQFENAEKYYLMAAAKDDIKAMGGLAVLYLLERKNKFEAVDLARKAFTMKPDAYTSGVYTIMLLWDENIEEAARTLELFMEKEGPVKLGEFFETLLMFLVARRQYDTVLELFTANKYDIKERYKPIYYALMQLMKDTYPDEYRKMGPELIQTVEEVLRRIDRIAVDYS